MSIVLYKLNASPPARTVLVTAEILGLDVETREVNLLSKEQLNPEYVKKNPLHTVPLLEDGDLVLADSHAIIIYLVSKYGNDKTADLYPEDVQQRAIVHQRLFLDASILFPRLLTIIRAIRNDNAPCVDEKKKADVEEAYGFLNTYLQASPFVAGEKLTIADICCVTTVSSLNILVPIDGKYSKLQEWLNILKIQDWYIAKNQPGLNDLAGSVKLLLERNNK